MNEFIHTILQAFEGYDKEFPFLGDPIWWQDFNKIDIARVRDSKSREYQNLRLIFFEFVYIFALIGFFVPLAYFFANPAVSEDLVNTHVGFWNLSDSNFSTSQDFWSWCEGTMIPKLYGTGSPVPPVATMMSESQTGAFFSVSEVPPVVESSDMVLVGAVRLQQWRVVDTGCSPSFEYGWVSVLCSGEFSAGANENTQPFYQESYPDGVSGGFFWQPSAGASSFVSNETGIFYPGSGYWYLLASSSASGFQAMAAVSELEASAWIDQLTAAVAVEVNAFHPISNAFVTDRILFEFPISGSMQSSLKVSPIKSESIVFAPTFSREGSLLLFLDLINLMLFLTGLAGFGYLVYSAGAKRLLSVFWTYLDMSILALFSAYLSVRADMYAKMIGIVGDGSFFPKNEAFYSISDLIPIQDSAISLQACILIALAIRALKFTQLFEVFRTLRAALTASFFTILALSVVLALVLIGFSFGLQLVTGFNDSAYMGIHNSFNTVGLSLLSVIRVTQVSGIAAFANLAFLFFVYLVLVPSILVVSAISWKVSQSSPDSQSSSMPVIKAFFDRFWNAIRKKIRIDSLPDSRGIDLDKLPSVIRAGVVKRRIQLMHRVEKHIGFIHLDFNPDNDFLSARELSNLLAEDPFARKILGSQDPDLVIRRFGESSGDDPIQSIQEDIMHKLDSIQKSGLNPSIKVDSRLGAISKQVSGVIDKLRSAMLEDIDRLNAVSASVLKNADALYQDFIGRNTSEVKKDSRK